MASFQRNFSAAGAAVCWLSLAYGHFGAYQAKVTELENRSFWLNSFIFMAGQPQCGLNPYQEGFLDAFRQDSQSKAYAQGFFATVLFTMANAIVQYAFIHPLKPLYGLSRSDRAVSLCNRTFILSAAVLSTFYFAEVLDIAQQSLERTSLASSFFSGALNCFASTTFVAYSFAKMALNNQLTLPHMPGQPPLVMNIGSVAAGAA